MRRAAMNRKQLLMFVTIVMVLFSAGITVMACPHASMRKAKKTNVKYTRTVRVELQKAGETIESDLKDTRDVVILMKKKNDPPPVPNEIVADITNPNGRVCYYAFDGKNHVIRTRAQKRPSQKRAQQLIAACQNDLKAKRKSR